jgi:hypothetical protein
MDYLFAADVGELKKKVSDMRSYLNPRHPNAKQVYSGMFALSLDPGVKQLDVEVSLLRIVRSLIRPGGETA